MGEDQPTPGTSVTHSTFWEVDQSSGSLGLLETGMDPGPRNPGQLLESSEIAAATVTNPEP